MKIQTEIPDIKNLSMNHITKRFPGVLASDDISLEINAHEVIALVGENGAGKTTLMNILMGLYSPDSGNIVINDKQVSFKSPQDAFSVGIGMVHQQYMLVHNMTVLENIALGVRSAWKFMRIDMQSIRQKIKDVCDLYGLVTDPDAYVWQLSVGEQQRVELIKTLVLGAKLLVLDEPTSALTPNETDDLIRILLEMKKKLPIIFISHKLDEVKKLSDRFVILRHGKVVFTGNTADHNASDIATMMTGRKVTLPKNTEDVAYDSVMLSIKDLVVKSDRGFSAVNKLNLDIRKGEILGLAGVAGNGQRELCEAINGLRSVESGSIVFDGINLEGHGTEYAISHGMGYIPEERNIEGIVPSFSIRENLILKDHDENEFCKNGFLKAKEITKNAEQLRNDFDIRSPNVSIQAGTLSGGNIQKLILAREINRNPKFLVAVYPIRGLDLGAAEFIHNKLLEERRKGMGILLISEELDEILDLSDRIAVIFKGSIQKILNKNEANHRNLGIYMAGLNEDSTGDEK